MSNGLNSDYSYSKSILLGFLLSLLVLSLSFTSLEVHRLIFDSENQSVDEFELNTLEWNFSTPESVAIGFKENLNLLFFSTIETGIVDSTINYNGSWGFASDGSFHKDIHRIILYSSVSQNYQNQVIDIRAIPTSEWLQKFWTIMLENDKGTKTPIHLTQPDEILNGLADSLSTDISRLNGLNNITDSQNEERSLLESQIGIKYWRLLHVYTDATYLEISIYNTTVFIENLELESLIWEEEFHFNPDIEKKNPVYIRNHSEFVLSDYTEAINSIIDSLTSL